MRNPIIAALDVSSGEAAWELAEKIAPFVGGFKIGSELFTLAGPDVVRRIRGLGAAVFLDLKFHDIPNTVARAVAVAVKLGVQMLSVHASGGSAMLRSAEKAAQATAGELGLTPPLVLAITVLTSLDGNALSEVGLDPNVARQVRRLAKMATSAGLRGVVCSPLELAELRQVLPANTQLVAPGIRPDNSPVDDQKRTLTPCEALAAGASWLVIGRPIYAAANPRQAAEAIWSSLKA
jgi:orotidine-5'-phosphate decarboxylase